MGDCRLSRTEDRKFASIVDVTDSAADGMECVSHDASSAVTRLSSSGSIYRSQIID